MAAVQTLHSMTLGNQQPKMYTMIQQHSPHQQNNCVIVTTGLPNAQTIVTTNQNITGKSVIQHNAKRPLAPAPERTSVVVNTASINNNNNINNNSDMLRCKRKINFAHHMPYSGHQPASVARRNARERNRVKQVNNGFATLRQHIPASVAAALSSSASSGGRGASKKLSKVETLRMAVEYIRSLQQMIEEHEAETASSTTSTSSVSSENIKLESQYYALSPSENSSVTMAQHLGQTMLLQQTPPCSEASASPTPSYSSEGSISTPNATYAPMVPYKPENYDNYEPMSPEDEELLDYITWWQQQ